jgi:NAD(P)-dependent dehydrogenase (short-subunit alcohol dehydrogenase family)
MPEPHASLPSFPLGGIAVVVGTVGGIGTALETALARSVRFAKVLGTRRGGPLTLDLLDEASIVATIDSAARHGEIRLLVNATGFLHGAGFAPEKSLRELDPAHLAHAFAVNAIGPALLMKHALPRFPRSGKAVFATLSARVGSIGDNRLGGWHAYRASKAALNQLVRTAAIELARRAPEAACVALHPGMVDTALSAPFAKAGLAVHAPADAARHLLSVIDGLGPAQSGGFYDWRGQPIPW